MFYNDERDLETDAERARREEQDALVARGGMRTPPRINYCRQCGKRSPSGLCAACTPPLTDADLDDVPF